VKRRDFITLIGGATAWPLTGRAQQSGGMRRIGVLTGTAQTDPETPLRIGALRETLTKLGWLENRNVVMEVRQTAETAARSLAVEFARAPARDAAAIESAVTGLAREPGGGVVVMPDAFTLAHRELIIALTARHRLPSISPFSVFTTTGALLCYGIDQVETYRLAASYVDRILKGEKPSDLPVQAPTKFELIINLKTAKALGLDVPWFLQQRADEVIE
jgi:ABC-type uncharacterized transport system substrate-binding protein